MDRREFLMRSGMTGAAGLAGMAGLSAASRKDLPSYDTRFNVRDFGAKGDGLTHDSEAIQKAIDEAGKVHGTVWFPAGIYLCHDLKVPPTVCLKADAVWLYRNEEAGAVLKLDDPHSSCMLDITGAFGVHIYGLVLEGDPDSPKKIHGIFLNNTKEWSPKEDTIVIDDVRVMKFSGHGVYLNRIWLFIIRHSIFISNKGDGVCIKGWDGFVTDNQFSGNGGNGFGTDEVGCTIMFTANRVEWNGKNGLELVGGDDWNITGNSFDRNYSAALDIRTMDGISVTGNVFRRSGKNSSDKDNPSCHIFLEGVKGISVVGNTFIAGQDDGGKGTFTPQVGFILKDMKCSAILGNTLYEGYMDGMLLDKGGHTDLVFKDNLGCKKE